MHVHLGYMTVTGLISALLADYMVVPALLRWTKPFASRGQSPRGIPAKRQPSGHIA